MVPWSLILKNRIRTEQEKTQKRQPGRIFMDGSSGADVAETVQGPATKDYNVTGTLRFVTSNPDGVTLTLDGEEVEPTDSRGNGVYTYTVDFPAILAAWEEEHAPADTGGDGEGASGAASGSGEGTAD